jgi:hypothetical protein
MHSLMRRRTPKEELHRRSRTPRSRRRCRINPEEVDFRPTTSTSRWISRNPTGSNQTDVLLSLKSSACRSDPIGETVLPSAVGFRPSTRGAFERETRSHRALQVPTLIFEHQQFLSIFWTPDSSSRRPPVRRDPLSPACQSTKHCREIPKCLHTSRFFARNHDWMAPAAK